MGNKKYLAIAIVLILGGGLGTFVFANPASPEEENPPEYNRNINDTNSGDNGINNNGNTNSNDVNGNDNQIITTPEESAATDNTVIPDVSSDTSINNNGVNNNGSNSSSNSANDSNNEVVPNENNSDSNNNNNNNNNDNDNVTDTSSINKVQRKDTTAPVLVVSTNNTTLTNKSVVVTITANEKIKSVTGWTLSSDGKAISKTITKNESGNVIVYDLAGNKSSISYNVKNIDKDSPILSANYSTKSSTNKDVTVTISANEKVKPVAGWILSSDAKTLTKVVSRNESGKVKTYDLAGNISNEIVYTVDNIDKVAPVLEEANYDIETLTNKDVTVTINANEKVKPVAGWTLSSDAKTLTKVVSRNESGKVKTYDLAGNISNEIVYTVDNIDKVAPEVKVTTSNSNGNKKTWKDVTVVITSNEPIKAVAGWDLLDNLTLTKTFSDNVKDIVKVSDLAGNEIEVPYEVKNIDKNSPEVTTIKTVTKQGKTTIQVKIEYSDGTIITKNVDENDKEIILDDGTVVPVQSSANLEIVLSNVIDGVSIKTNEPVTAMIKSDKEIASWTLSNDEFNWNLTDSKTLISDDIYKISDQYVTVEDILGNLTTIYVNVLNVDAIAPTINSVKASEKSGGIEVKFTASERLNVIDSWKNTTTRITFTKVFTKDEITKPIEVTLVDLYDNSSKITIYVTDNGDGTYSASFKTEEELEKEQILELCS